MRYLIGAISAAALLVMAPQLACAQSLKEKLIGAYTLVEGSEVSADGKKVVPWAKGSLQLSPAGRVSFFVLPKERAKTDSVRTPAGPMVAYYGTYTVDEAANTFTITVDGASSPAFEGATRVQTLTFQGDTMTATGSKVDTPQGPITPVNVWKKLPVQ
ncbi:MAG TPA: lipocalin-like domain-containing protein [Xanthobacteraceae bacterium]|nr:lipocalin-like domain-containing protein [Xanthobacteraceae bacterium]